MTLLIRMAHLLLTSLLHSVVMRFQKGTLPATLLTPFNCLDTTPDSNKVPKTLVVTQQGPLVL